MAVRERADDPRRLLVWDAPNMDMVLAEVIGERPSPRSRPRMDVLAAWAVARCAPGDQVELCVFANVGPGKEAAMASWVATLRHAGWWAFVKPKQQRRDDVDREMVGHIRRRCERGSLVDLIVASHDAKAFAGPLATMAEGGLAVSVLGFRERDVFAHAHERIGFVDVEDVPGLFEVALPRTNLFDLPSGGRWFEPFAPLTVADPAAAPSGAEPSGAEVVDFVVGVAVSRADGVSLRDVGQELRERFPQFSLERAGFPSVGELLRHLAADGRVTVTRSSEDHRLLSRTGRPTSVIDLTPSAAPRESVDPEPDDSEPDDSEPDDPGSGSETPPTEAPEVAGPDRTLEPALDLEHEIYRTFGYRPRPA